MPLTQCPCFFLSRSVSAPVSAAPPMAYNAPLAAVPVPAPAPVSTRAPSMMELLGDALPPGAQQVGD